MWWNKVSRWEIILGSVLVKPEMQKDLRKNKLRQDYNFLAVIYLVAHMGK